MNSPTNEFPDISSDLSVTELVQMYIQTREFLSQEKKAFEALEANMKDIRARISMCLRDNGDELGVDSFKTPFGTAYRSIKTSYRVGKWEDILQFIKDTGNYQILEKRVCKNACREIHLATGEVPPGVEFSQEVEFNVRAS